MNLVTQTFDILLKKVLGNTAVLSAGHTHIHWQQYKRAHCSLLQ
jgi:hypothetical protein